jgi:hypothetical protein
MALIALIAVAIVSGIITSSFNQSNSTGTIIGSGNLITKDESFTDFTSVSVNSGFKFDITHSDSYTVTVTCNDNLVDYLQVTRSGSTLQISLKPGYSFQLTSLKVEITMPNLYSLDLNGGATGTVSGFSSSHDFAFTSSGGATVNMSGSARDLQIDASGGSHLNLSSFQVNNAVVNISGGCQVGINLNGRLDATASGGANLTYLGNPTLGNINTSGGGTVSKK